MAKNGPQVEKPRPIEIVSVKRTRKTIAIKWRQGDATFDLNERDNPLPSFYEALDALPPIVATVCHFPPTYADEGLRVIGVVIGEKGETPTASFIVRKDIDDAAKEFAFKTPERLLAHPTNPGKYTPPLSNKDADLVYAVVEEAKRYVMGERAQGQIAFEDEGEEQGDGPLNDEGDPLPGMNDAAAPAPKKRGRPRKAPVVPITAEA